ncbi:MAG: MarR family transcriptional regulator [Porticoccaceae bacterium]|nr:MAG: MarR family transcriptional regulator [Porticoccaceae bacterium]
MKSNDIYNHVERLSELLRVDSRQAGAAYGLQPIQLEVLHYLSICNRYSDTPKAVTEYLGQTKGTVSQTLMLLEGKGLLSKITDEYDKRVSHLKISPKGASLLQKTIPSPIFIKACEILPDNKQTEIVAALKTLLLTLLQANSMKTFDMCHTCRYNIKTEEGGYFCDLVKQPLADNEIELICREHEFKNTGS